jgi:hypothetical protein
MEKIKNYIIAALGIIILVLALINPIGHRATSGKEQLYKDSLAVYKYEKAEIDKKVFVLEDHNKLLTKSVEALDKQKLKIQIIYKEKTQAIENFTHNQVDSAFAATYPIPVNVVVDTTTVSCNPTWRIREAEIGLAAGMQAIELNQVLAKEEVKKDSIIVDDKIIISELQEKDSINEKQRATLMAAHKEETEQLKVDNGKLKRRNKLFIVIGIGLLLLEYNAR